MRISIIFFCITFAAHPLCADSQEHDVDIQEALQTISSLAHVGATVAIASGLGCISNIFTEQSVRAIRDEISPDTHENLNAYLADEATENCIVAGTTTLATCATDAILDTISPLLAENLGVDTDATLRIYHITRIIDAIVNISGYLNHSFHPDVHPTHPDFHIKAGRHRDRNNMLSAETGILLAQAAEPFIYHEIQALSN